MAFLQQMLVLCFILFNANSIHSVQFDYPSAVKGTKWINNPSLPHSISFTDGSLIRAILLSGNLGPSFAAGFYCKTAGSSSGSCNQYLFGVFIVVTNSASGIVMPNFAFPQLIWAANRNRPVGLNATLDFRRDGNLVLYDHDGTLVWNSGTLFRPVGLNITSAGNLVLHDGQNIIWQSFNHPSDTLVPSQILNSGAKLYGSVSSSNYSEGPYYLAMQKNQLAAYASASKPQIYWAQKTQAASTIKSPFVIYKNGSIDLFASSASKPDSSIAIPAFGANSIQYLKLEPSGRIRLYNWGYSKGWTMQYDLTSEGFFATMTESCSLPSSCGRYGICTDGECSCIHGFFPIDKYRPSKGCYRKSALPSCKNPKRSKLLKLGGLDYFANDFSDGTGGLSSYECQDSCLKDCNCMAAFYKNSAAAANRNTGGVCYSIDTVYTLRNGYRGYGYVSDAFVKV